MRRSAFLAAILLSSVALPVSVSAKCHYDGVNAADGVASDGYKCGYFDGEIPETWSAVYNGPDIIPMGNARMVSYGGASRYVEFIRGKPFYSVAKNIVSYGDMNWSQIDFYFTSGKNVDSTIALLKKRSPENLRWSTAKVGSKEAIVAEQGLDEGEVTKGGPGGKFYFVSWPFTYEGGSYKAGLIIHKQALGSTEFENGTKHVLESLPDMTWEWLSVPHERFKIR